jgi:cobalamin synthase
VVILCASLIWRIKGLITLLIIAVCSYAIGKFVNKKIGGITGDTLGMTIELMEITTLLTVCIGERIIYG